MIKLYHKIFGEPIYIKCRDSQVIKSRLKKTKCGKILVRKICGWVEANEDGTVDGSYVKTWFRR